MEALSRDSCPTDPRGLPGAIENMKNSAPICAGTAAYRKFSFALVIAGFATFSQLYGIQSLLPILSRVFRVSAGDASLVVSLSTGPLAITLIAASVVSDRIGRQRIMIASLFAGSVLTVAS